jgi:hypothetical protein
LLQFAQRWRQLQGGRMLGVLCQPVIDGGLLLLQGARGLGGASQPQPPGQVGLLAGLQLFAGQAGDQAPDAVVVACGGCAAEQWGDVNAFASGGQDLSIGLQGAGARQLGAHLLFD